MPAATRLIVMTGLLGACAAPPPLPPPPAPELPPALLPAEVWTARPGVPLRADSARVHLPRPLTRLEVVGSDSTGLLRVRCLTCPGEVVGSVERGDVLSSPLSPELAAGSSLAEFALAVRHAAARHDLEALRPVMAPEFSFSFLGPQGREQAIRAWQASAYQQLDSVAALLDRGLSTRDSALWAAPPEFLERLGYHGPRAGFRRGAGGRWEWVFLIRGEGAD